MLLLSYPILVSEDQILSRGAHGTLWCVPGAMCPRYAALAGLWVVVTQAHGLSPSRRPGVPM